MIKLLVRRDRRGRFILINKTPPKGVMFVLPMPRHFTPMDKKLNVMWKDFDNWQDNSKRGEDDHAQQKRIALYAKKHFKVNLTWKPVIIPNDEFESGWPTKGYWRSNKSWFNREIKRLVRSKP